MKQTFDTILDNHIPKSKLDRVCKCGQGYVSFFDGKCGQHGCRNKREREAHKRWYSQQ